MKNLQMFNKNKLNRFNTWDIWNTWTYGSVQVLNISSGELLQNENYYFFGSIIVELESELTNRSILARNIIVSTILGIRELIR